MEIKKNIISHNISKYGFKYSLIKQKKYIFGNGLITLKYDNNDFFSIIIKYIKYGYYLTDKGEKCFYKYDNC